MLNLEGHKGLESTNVTSEDPHHPKTCPSLCHLPKLDIYFFFLGIQARNKISFPLIQLGKLFLHFKHLGISIFIWAKPVYLETLPYF